MSISKSAMPGKHTVGKLQDMNLSIQISKPRANFLIIKAKIELCIQWQSPGQREVNDSSCKSANNPITYEERVDLSGNRSYSDKKKIQRILWDESYDLTSPLWHSSLPISEKQKNGSQSISRVFPGCPVVTTCHSNSVGPALILSWGAKFPYASQPKK